MYCEFDIALLVHYSLDLLRLTCLIFYILTNLCGVFRSQPPSTAPSAWCAEDHRPHDSFAPPGNRSGGSVLD